MAPSATTEQHELAQYTVTVHTSDLPGAGTDCSAYISVHGRDGETGKQELRADGRGFARGSVEMALVQGRNVGQMLYICVGHNDEGKHLSIQFWLWHNKVLKDSLHCFPAS